MDLSSAAAGQQTRTLEGRHQVRKVQHGFCRFASVSKLPGEAGDLIRVEKEMDPRYEIAVYIRKTRVFL